MKKKLIINVESVDLKICLKIVKKAGVSWETIYVINDVIKWCNIGNIRVEYSINEGWRDKRETICRKQGVGDLNVRFSFHQRSLKNTVINIHYIRFVT